MSRLLGGLQDWSNLQTDALNRNVWIKIDARRVSSDQPNNPLHGKTLEAILQHLVDHYGWKELGLRIKIRCFTDNPSIHSSLKFLRKTPWARKKVESLYLESIAAQIKNNPPSSQ